MTLWNHWIWRCVRNVFVELPGCLPRICRSDCIKTEWDKFDRLRTIFLEMYVLSNALMESWLWVPYRTGWRCRRHWRPLPFDQDMSYMWYHLRLCPCMFSLHTLHMRCHSCSNPSCTLKKNSWAVVDIHSKILDAPRPIFFIFMYFLANFGQIIGWFPPLFGLAPRTPSVKSLATCKFGQKSQQKGMVYHTNFT